MYSALQFILSLFNYCSGWRQSMIAYLLYVHRLLEKLEWRRSYAGMNISWTYFMQSGEEMKYWKRLQLSMHFFIYFLLKSYYQTFAYSISLSLTGRFTSSGFDIYGSSKFFRIRKQSRQVQQLYPVWSVLWNREKMMGGELKMLCRKKREDMLIAHILPQWSNLLMFGIKNYQVFFRGLFPTHCSQWY